MGGVFSVRAIDIGETKGLCLGYQMKGLDMSLYLTSSQRKKFEIASGILEENREKMKAKGYPSDGIFGGSDSPKKIAAMEALLASGQP